MPALADAQAVADVEAATWFGQKRWRDLTALRAQR